MAVLTRGFCVLVLVYCLLVTSAVGQRKSKNQRSVTYDGRSLIVNGGRELLFSGSIHYPRSPPEMWPDLIIKAKEGGLNVIQTYVFWNIHEPVQGQYNFEGNYDLVKFIKLIGEQGLYASLRFHMQKFTTMIVDMLRKEKLFAPQGGPIIMSQIENEYNSVQLAYRDMGVKYVHWAANMAVGLQTGVPWVMCKQMDAPDPVINTCNGRHCGDTFPGPNSPNKPSLWTENWTAQYRVFGDPPSQRAAEDIAYSVARFFSKNGTFTNYYMYYGGTNYGRTGSSFVTTRYYDEAPIDEFGLRREPKFGHLRDLHRALRLSKKALLWGVPTVQRISNDLEIRVYEKPGTDICAAFLTNNHTKIPATINFRGQDYFLPRRSISILPDCKTLVFNTQTMVAQHNARKFHPSKKAGKLKWVVSQESIPNINELPIKNKIPLELYSLTKDTSDYAWYSTSITFDRLDLPMRSDILPVLQIANLGHAMVAFVNGEYIGFGHGSNIEKSFVFQKPINLKPGVNHISLLSMTVGLPNSGANMEKRFAGPRAITIQGLNAGTLDVTLNNWGHEVGVKGEKLELQTEEGSQKVKWSPAGGAGPPLTWYKTYFDLPEGQNPVAVRLTTMGKGIAWVNGKSIGRYWVNYLSPLGQPSQSDFISEVHPPSVKTWQKEGGQMTVVEDVKSGAHLTCPDDKVIKSVDFASFGDPSGSCGNFVEGKCTSPNSEKVVAKYCLGKNSCSIPLEREIFDDKSHDGCPDILKVLAVQARCGRNKSKSD
ncbi:hypothetical protein C3L33_20719, partial [Rhododendron williamsianum]